MKNLFKSRKLDLIGILALITAVLLMFNFASCQPNVASTTYYTVTFDANGGSEVSSQKIESGKTATLPNSTKTGYYLSGWYNGKTLFDFSTPITSDLTLKAKWTAYTYTDYSVFYADGVNDAEITVPTDSTKYSAGSTVTVLFDGIGKRLGYNFVGWSDGENTYTSGGTTTFEMGTRNVTLTALWETNIKVSFSDDSINLLPLKSATIDVTVTNPDSLSLTFSVSSSSSNVSASWDSTNKQIKLENKLPYLFADKITITFEIGNAPYPISKTLNVTSLVSDSDIDGTLTVNSAESTTLSDWTQLTYSTEKKVYIYKLNCSKANVAYRILNADTVSAIESAMRAAGITVIDSKYYLFDSSSNEIAGVDDGVLSVTPEKSCTYYLVVYPYRYNNSNPTQYVGSTAIYTYSVSAITSLSLSENAVTLDAGGYADYGKNYRASASFTQNGSGSETITVYGALPGTATITLTDSVSSLSTQCTVTVSIDDSSATEISSSSIGNAASTTQSDWTQVALTSAGQASVYKISLEANKTYTFEIADSGCNSGMVVNGTKVDALFSLYDSSFTVIKQLDYSSSNDKITVTPQSNASYYFIVSPYNAGRTGAAAFHVYVSE